MLFHWDELFLLEIFNSKSKNRDVLLPGNGNGQTQTQNATSSGSDSQSVHVEAGKVITIRASDCVVQKINRLGNV